MGLNKRGKVYYTDFTWNGVRYQKSCKTGDRKLAQRVELTQKQEVMQQYLNPEKHCTLTLSAAFKKVYKERWCVQKDGERSLRRAEIITQLIGDKVIAQVSDADVVTVREYYSGEAPATVNRNLIVLNTVLQSAVRWRVLRNAPHVQLLKVPASSKREGTISLKEEALLVRAASDLNFRYLADMIPVLIDTGLRLSEFLKLKSVDVNTTTNEITVSDTKNDKSRKVPMTLRVRVLLPKLIVQRSGVNKDALEYAFKLVRIETGLKDLVIHSCRHTCASRLLNAGVSLYTVKEWLGHSSVKTTERYAHLSNKQLHIASEVLNAE